MRLCADCYKVLVRGKPFDENPTEFPPCQSCGRKDVTVREIRFRQLGLDLGGAQTDA